MSTFVTVSHGSRQYKIACTPTKVLNDVLVEACTKVEVNPDEYGLRHGKTTLDLSLSFRLAHLPVGAKLDLVRVSANAGAKVNVALNLPNTPRKVTAVPPSHSLWQVLEQFEAENNLAITELGAICDGIVYRHQPIVQLMNKEYSTTDQLQRTSLSSIGIKSGSAVMRVSYRKTDEVFGSLKVHTTLPGTVVRSTEDLDDTSTVRDAPIVDTIMSGEPQTMSASKLAPPLPRSREVEVLTASTSGTPHYSAIPQDDTEDQKMSVEQARVYQSSLASRGQSSSPLLTQKLRDQQAAEKRDKSKPEKCRVKFRFNDGTQIISSFDPSEPASELYNFVRTTLTLPQSDFSLEILGDRRKVVDSDSRLWQDLSFSAAVAVQVVGSVEVLEEYKKLGKDVKLIMAQKDLSGTEASSKKEDMSAIKEERSTTSGKDQESDNRPLKKVPKWLQKTLGKK